ncbi:MAG: hypothetical protein ACLRSW_10940 [Christensenellaceae bacterium]
MLPYHTISVVKYENSVTSILKGVQPPDKERVQNAREFGVIK